MTKPIPTNDDGRAQEISIAAGFDAMRICMGLEPQNYNAADVAKWFTLAAARRGVGAAEKVKPDSVAVLSDPPDHAVALDGQWAGWLLWCHPDGQWVTIKKLEIEQPGSPF